MDPRFRAWRQVSAEIRRRSRSHAGRGYCGERSKRGGQKTRIAGKIGPKGIPLNRTTGVQEGKILLTAEQIQRRVKELAEQISKDFRGKTCCAVGVLENGFMFMAHLVRRLDVPGLCRLVTPLFFRRQP